MLRRLGGRASTLTVVVLALAIQVIASACDEDFKVGATKGSNVTISGQQIVHSGDTVTFTVSGQGFGNDRCPEVVNWSFDNAGVSSPSKVADMHPSTTKVSGNCVTSTDAGKAPHVTFVMPPVSANANAVVNVELSADGGLKTTSGGLEISIHPSSHQTTTPGTTPATPPAQGTTTPTSTGGNATVSFGTSVNYPANAHATGVAAADLHLSTGGAADGRADVLVSDDATPSNSFDFIDLWPSHTDGTLDTTGTPYSSGQGADPRGIAIADFDGDGKPDFAVSDYEGGATSGGVTVFRNNGDGSGFTLSDPSGGQTSTPYSVAAGPLGIATGKLYGSAHDDLVAASSAGNDASVLLNGTGGNPPGTFGDLSLFGAGGTDPVGVATGDFNGDGKPDIVTAVAGGGGSVAILRNTSTTSGSPPTTTLNFDNATPIAAYTGNIPSGVAVGDLNGDGKPDVVVSNESDGTVSVLLNATSPGATTFSFAETKYSVRAGQPAAVALGDFNGDGKLDIATANAASANASVLPNNGDGTFGTAVQVPAGQAPDAVAAGDVNGDGRADLIVGNYGTAPPADGAGSVTVALSSASAHASLVRAAAFRRSPTHGRTLHASAKLLFLGLNYRSATYGADGTGHLLGAAARAKLSAQLKGSRKSLKGLPAGLLDLLSSDIYGSGNVDRYFDPRLSDPIVLHGTAIARSRRHAAVVGCVSLTPGPAAAGEPPTTERFTLTGGTGAAAGLRLTVTFPALSLAKPDTGSVTMTVSSGRNRGLNGTCKALLKKLLSKR